MLNWKRKYNNHYFYKTGLRVLFLFLGLFVFFSGRSNTVNEGALNYGRYIFATKASKEKASLFLKSKGNLIQKYIRKSRSRAITADATKISETVYLYFSFHPEYSAEKIASAPFRDFFRLPKRGPPVKS